MDRVLTRTTRRMRPPLGHLLLAMAHATTEGLISPQRGLSLEWFRFPLP